MGGGRLNFTPFPHHPGCTSLCACFQVSLPTRNESDLYTVLKLQFYIPFQENGVLECIKVGGYFTPFTPPPSVPVYAHDFIGLANGGSFITKKIA